MLVREPKDRPTLREICEDPWVNSGKPLPRVPVISRDMITETDHIEIIKKMVEGNLAPKEDIIR